MKKVFALAAVLFAFVCLDAKAQVQYAFEDNLLDEVVPKGWHDWTSGKHVISI